MDQVSRAYWIGAMSGAEAVGIALVATTYAAVDRGMIGAETAAVLIAGGLEGLCLGVAQGMGLRRLGARLGPWVTLTVLAAVIGYGLSMLGQAGGAGEEASVDPPAWLMALAGAGVGLGMGAVMGLLQAPALPRTVRKWHWVLAKVAGWVPGMAAIMVAAGLAGRDWPLWQVSVLGAASGAVAGACVAGATWMAIGRVRV